MLQLQPEKLAPHMEQIIEYMLESTQVLVNSTGVVTASSMLMRHAFMTSNCVGHYSTLHVCV